MNPNSNYRKKCFLLSVVILLIIASCGDPTENQSTNSPQFQDKFVSFSTNEELEKETGKVATMTDPELDLWEKEHSFVSYRTILNQAFEEWPTLTSTQDQLNFLNK